MPITFVVEPETGVLHTCASGIVSRVDVLGHIEAKITQGVTAQVELFDARNITLDLSIADLHEIAVTARRSLGSKNPGKVAVVTNNSFVYGLAKTYGALAAQDHPQFQVFHSMDDATRWARNDGKK